MKYPNLKHICKLSTEHKRKRDNEDIPYSITIGLTFDEALELSEYFKSTLPNDPKRSLIRAFLLSLSSKSVSEELLIELSTKLKTRAELTDHLSQSDADTAFALLYKHKQDKAKPSPRPPIEKPIEQKKSKRTVPIIVKRSL